MRYINLFLTCSILAACGQWAEQSDAWRNEFREFKNTVNTRMDELTVAIPGERLLRLIEDTHSDNPDVKRVAQATVRRLFLVDPEVSYQVTVWFDFDDRYQLQADIFLAETWDRSHVVARANSRSITPTEVQSTRLSDRTFEEVRLSVRESLAVALSLLAGEPKSVALDPHHRGHYHAPVNVKSEVQDWGDGALQPLVSSVRRFEQYSEVADQFARFVGHLALDPMQESLELEVQERRDPAIDALEAAVMAPYIGTSLPLDNAYTLATSWSTYAPRPYLFVVIPEEKWKQLRPVVRALVHGEGDVTQVFQHARAYTFREKDFEISEPVDDPVHGPLVWAAHNMSQSTVYSEGTIQSLEALKAYMAEYEKKFGDQ